MKKHLIAGGTFSLFVFCGGLLCVNAWFVWEIVPRVPLLLEDVQRDARLATWYGWAGLWLLVPATGLLLLYAFQLASQLSDPREGERRGMKRRLLDGVLMMTVLIFLYLPMSQTLEPVLGKLRDPWRLWEGWWFVAPLIISLLLTWRMRGTISANPGRGDWKRLYGKVLLLALYLTALVLVIGWLCSALTVHFLFAWGGYKVDLLSINVHLLLCAIFAGVLGTLASLSLGMCRMWCAERSLLIRPVVVLLLALPGFFLTAKTISPTSLQERLPFDSLVRELGLSLAPAPKSLLLFFAGDGVVSSVRANGTKSGWFPMHESGLVPATEENIQALTNQLEHPGYPYYFEASASLLHDLYRIRYEPERLIQLRKSYRRDVLMFRSIKGWLPNARLEEFLDSDTWFLSPLAREDLAEAFWLKGLTEKALEVLGESGNDKLNALRAKYGENLVGDGRIHGQVTTPPSTSVRILLFTKREGQDFSTEGLKKFFEEENRTLGGCIASTRPDEAGAFAFDELPQGDYMLAVAFEKDAPSPSALESLATQGIIRVDADHRQIELPVFKL